MPTVGASLLPHATNLHLLKRLTYGPSPASLAEIVSLGAPTWLRQQLAPATINDSVCDKYLTRYPRLNYSIPTVRIKYATMNGSWDLMSDLGQATLLRALSSKRQLFEMMVEFWSNHLNVTSPSSDVWDNRHDYDRYVIRRYAMARYEDMLWASATHPAMMRYLNNADSQPPDFNENYGRELLELHTVGVDAGYTEVDMRNSALIMSGFGVHDVWAPAGKPIDPKNGTFEFAAKNHYIGPVTVMGFSNANSTGAGGYNVGRAYIHYLAHHPATARRIADKLVTRFVSDDPQPDLAAALAATYLAADTNITAVLTQLFDSPEFRFSDGLKVRRPLEHLMASMRVLSVTPDPGNGTSGLEALWWESDQMGQQPLAWHLPNGYADTATDWQSTNSTLERWNLNITAAAQWWIVRQGDPKDPNNQPMLQAPAAITLLPKPLPATYGEVVDALAQRLLFGPLTPEGRAGLLAFMGKSATSTAKASDGMLSWQLPYVVALILDSAQHAMR